MHVVAQNRTCNSLCVATCSLGGCVCRQASRSAILAAIGTLLPSKVPFGLGKPDSPPPAVLLTSFVDSQIARFQARVTAKAAEHRAETRWWWQRRLDTFAANFRWVRWTPLEFITVPGNARRRALTRQSVLGTGAALNQALALQQV